MNMEKNNAPLLEMRNIKKGFFGNQVLTDINFTLKEGEVLGLVGENGAGKSTLMKILFGMDVIRETGGYEGDVLIDGEKVQFNTPFDALKAGIGMVHQHFQLIDVFTVLDNIILGVEPTNSAGFLKKTEARRRVVELSEKYGLRIEPDALISDITVGMQQRTEILKMLNRNNEILIFDEPTAVLTPQESDELMEIMRSLAAEGKSILFISHANKNSCTSQLIPIFLQDRLHSVPFQIHHGYCPKITKPPPACLFHPCIKKDLKNKKYTYQATP